MDESPFDEEGQYAIRSILEAADFSRIVIVGYPSSGKTTFANCLVKAWGVGENSGTRLYRTDDYIDHGFEKALYVMIEDMLKAGPGPYILEGIQGYRFLRKVEEREPGEVAAILPDVVVVCRTTRPPERRHLSTRKGLDTTMARYHEIKRRNIPIVEYWN